MLTSYLQSVSSAAAGDVLLSYSADQIISRVTIEGNAYEKQIADLMVREYVHSADVLENNLKVLEVKFSLPAKRRKFRKTVMFRRIRSFLFIIRWSMRFTRTCIRLRILPSIC